MDVLNSVGVLMGSSWASGLNLYLCTAGLGIAQRMDWISLPGDMTVLAHPQIIAVAVVMFVIEFVADKIPYVDSVWDSIHTFIRPLAGAAMGYIATSDAGSVPQMLVALATGSLTLGSHMAKATTRAAINTSPEPVTNSVASVTEDVTVMGLLYLMIAHPVLASLAVLGLIVVSVWLLKKFYPFAKRIFEFYTARKKVKA